MVNRIMSLYSAVAMASFIGTSMAHAGTPEWAQPPGTEEAQRQQAEREFRAPNAFEMMDSQAGGKGAPNAFEMMNQRQGTEGRAGSGAPNALENPPNALGNAPNALQNPPNAFEMMNRNRSN